MSGQGNGAAAPGKDCDDAVEDNRRMPRSDAPRHPRAAALRAQAHAHRLLADAEEAEASALENETSAPDPDALLTERTWPADLAVTWRTIHEAARRGEIPVTRAGRTPCYRRGDVVEWLSARTERRPRVAPASSAADEYRAIVRNIR